jgi:uncharacterized membrane protein
MHVLAAAATLGALTGGRTFAVPALLARGLAAVAPHGEAGPLARTLSSDGAARTLGALAIAELVRDKLPMAGARIEPLPLLARVVSGAFSGAVAAELLGKRKAAPALVAAGAAFLGAHAAYHLRRKIRRKADVADPVVAAGEDAVVVGVGAEVVAGLVDYALAGRLQADAPAASPA